MDDYEFESVTRSPQSVSNPTEDRYNKFIEEQYVPGIAPQKPSTLGRVLSAVQGGVSGFYANTPNAIDPKETQRRQQSFLYGNYPERVEQLGNAASVLERSANQERQRRHDDILQEYYSGMNRERGENRTRLEQATVQAGKRQDEDDRRMREVEFAKVVQGSATSPGAIPQSNIPKVQSTIDIAPDLPGAPALSKSMERQISAEGEAPGYTKFSMRDGGGQIQQLAQPPVSATATRGTAYIEARIKAAKEALPFVIKAIDNLPNTSEEEKENFRLTATASAEGGTNPHNVVMAELADENRRNLFRFQYDKEMRSLKASTAFATGRASAQGSAGVGRPQLLEVPETGDPAMWFPSTGEVKVAPGGLSKPASPLSQGTQQQLSGLLTSTKKMANIEKNLKTGVYKTLGPVAGRITLAQASPSGLNNFGLTPTQIKMVVELKDALMDKSFGEGGKQLTPTEKEMFGWVEPLPNDTLESAIIKAANHLKTASMAIKSRWSTIDPKQRKRLGSYMEELKRAGVDTGDMAPTVPGGPSNKNDPMGILQ